MDAENPLMLQSRKAKVVEILKNAFMVTYLVKLFQ
jgi:hypothetical protein